jgi:hypothetical protein
VTQTTAAGIVAVEVTAMASGFNRNIGMLLLGVWLVLTGLSGMVALGLPSMLMAILALLAGILIIAGR